MKKNLTLLLSFLCFLFGSSALLAQTVVINSNPGTSGNIVTGGSNYHAMEVIYTESEIGATNFITPGTAITHVNFSVNIVGLTTTSTNFRLYMKDVPLATTSFVAGAYDTTTYTLVYNGSLVAGTVGFAGFNLNTPYVRTAGTNLQILIKRTDGIIHTGYVWDASVGNTSGGATVNSTRRYNNTTPPISVVSSLALSTFRPLIMLRHSPNDAAIQQVYTLGKLPIPYATPHVISANILNTGLITQTSLTVTLNVTGANTFTNNQVIPSLAPGASTTISFAGFTPTVTGNENVTVTLPNDDYTTDNTFTVAQLVTTNSFSYAYGTVAAGGVGFNGGTGDFVAKFNTSIATTINQVSVNFSAGGQPFQVGIWDASGAGGTPGALLYTSPGQTSTAGVYTLAISPAVAVSGNFYVGVRQTGTTNVSFSFQVESPIRSNTFYFTSPSGGTTWTDFAPANSFRFMIEPRLTLANDVGVSTIDVPVAGVNSFCNTLIAPKATIANFGSVNQAFNVTAEIRQGAAIVYTDTKSVSMNSSTTQQVSFNPSFNPIPGTAYTAKVYTSLGTDADRTNDSVTNSFTYQQVDYGGGGPTSGGYYFANSTPCAASAPSHPTYGWGTQATTEVTTWNPDGDDGISAALPLTFPFTFFGTVYNQLWIGTNGWVTFSDPTAVSLADLGTPVPIPTAGGLDNYIAGVLMDLDVRNATYVDAHVYYGGDASRFVITFMHAQQFGSVANYITFQIVLFPNGKIQIQYDNAQTTNPLPTAITNGCTVGIENAGGTLGIQYRFGTTGGPMFGSPLAVAFFTDATALPVTVTDFNASRGQAGNLLTWNTSQEFNINKFIAERSADGRTFTSIGEVAAAGNSTTTRHYQLIDQSPIKGINYYRIRVVDLDNSSKLTEVKSVRNLGTADFVVTPNPVSHALKVIINTDNADRGNIIITDANGRQTLNKVISVNQGSNSIDLDVANLASGVYIIKIQLSNDHIVKKFSKL